MGNGQRAVRDGVAHAVHTLQTLREAQRERRGREDHRSAKPSAPVVQALPVSGRGSQKVSLVAPLGCGLAVALASWHVTGTGPAARRLAFSPRHYERPGASRERLRPRACCRARCAARSRHRCTHMHRAPHRVSHHAPRYVPRRTSYRASRRAHTPCTHGVRTPCALYACRHQSTREQTSELRKPVSRGQLRVNCLLAWTCRRPARARGTARRIA